MVETFSIINHDELCSLIPHSFDMCLLDRVEVWDENTITCYSNSHRLDSNPLRRNETLSSVHLLEYAAQAMAVHGGLHDREEGKQMSEGYLAALRDIKIDLCNIDSIEEEIKIEARKIMSQAGNMIYSFTVFAGENTLVEGRATVVAISHS